MVLIVLVGWSLFAFAGAYTWTAIPLLAGALWLTGIVRPAIGRDDMRLIDAALCLCLAWAAVQLVPVPQSIRLALSPGSARIDRALYFQPQTDPTPLSVDTAATIESLAIAVACTLTFWSALRMFESGSLRRAVRTVAMCGLAVSAIAIVQHATAPRMMYWIWTPLSPGASPYGPFVNKNDLAAWLVMAIPLTVGYLIARNTRTARYAFELDSTTVWLGGAICAMAICLLASLSRSGLIAGIAATAALLLSSRARTTSRSRVAMGLGVALVAAIALASVNTGAIMIRLNDAATKGIAGRSEIWTLTRSMIRDFWVTGVGVGAYPRAMSVYQPPHQFAFNHAHNEYLQVLTEGGVVLGVAAAIVIVAGARVAARRLAVDRTPVFWMRTGAVSAVVAIGVQSIWETGLRMPANGILFAVCAAVALHSPAKSA